MYDECIIMYNLYYFYSLLKANRAKKALFQRISLHIFVYLFTTALQQIRPRALKCADFLYSVEHFEIGSKNINTNYL